MKSVLLSTLLVLSAWTWAAAESSVWKAQKDNSVIYLGGTVHVLREKDYPLPAEFDKAYKASEIIVFETDIGKLQEEATQRKLLANAKYADGSTIDKHLSTRVYADLSAYCAANGIPLQKYSQLKPAVLMTTLEMMEFMKIGATRQGVDLHFYALAKKARKAVEGLETIDEQINFMIALADDDENEFVAYSLRNMKSVKYDFELLVNAWRKGDATRLDELMIADLKTRQPNLYKKLITDRNSNWLPLIDAYQKTPQTEFILVGAAHLVGAAGIIEELRKKGYRVDKL